MIKLERTQILGWEPAIRGMRNPLNSWDKSDSGYGCDQSDEHFCSVCESGHDDSCPNRFQTYKIGPNDHDLAMRLVKGGPSHAKFRRMIQVYVDITAPIYWLAEMDTYKVSTVRNSCSFMHKGVSKPFEISDFSVKDERIYDVLNPIPKKKYELTYPYDTDEFRIYTDHNGRTYRVYRNGLIIREAFDYIDTWGTGRTRHYDEDKATIYQDPHGYFMIKLSGRNGGHMPLHRMVALAWCDKPEGTTQVNHIDGNKGNNCVENLEWVTASENMQKAIASGLFDELGGIHKHYKLWKTWSRLIPIQDRPEFLKDADTGMTYTDLAEKWGIAPKQANQLRYDLKHSKYEDLFQECYKWEQVIDHLNYLRALYLETKDEQIFQAIRSEIPQGYLQMATFMLNYETLSNIYETRRNHRLDEWRELCSWIERLPYSEFITGKVSEDG